MNRSVLSEVFHSTTLRVFPGTLVVAVSWRHPSRGPVDCPAHRLVGAHVRRAGVTTDHRPLHDGDLRDDLTAPPTTVVAVSYEKPEGGHCGIALAARSEDTAALQLAHRQIESWKAVLRTRRVLHVAPRTAKSTVNGPRPRSTPVPPQSSSNSPSSWQTCGCPARVGCPSAENVQLSLRRFLDRGDEVVVVGVPAGGRGAGATWSKGALREGAGWVVTPQQAETLAVVDPDRLAFVVAPGAVVSEAAAVLKVLRRRFPRLRGQHPREWCYTMDDLHTATGSLLAQSDVLLVTGRGISPAVRVAVTYAARTGVRVFDITALDRLRPEDIDAATITVLDAEDDGREYRGVTRALDGLGPTNHVWRHVSTSTAAPRSTRTLTVP
ncbi:4-hydroxy-3-methylbut-2-enyl diphosphate reductase [Streptomyces sp. NPDC005808]|uniref:4-hydroxy-3-methylbut-2-enyl diphosphate reductase n=1 Tax=Streptomyces sp. NPDC005808 TaxID=3364734 RepID=UPI0036BEF157